MHLKSLIYFGRNPIVLEFGPRSPKSENKQFIKSGGCATVSNNNCPYKDCCESFDATCKA